MLGARGEIIVSATHSLVVERSIIKIITTIVIITLIIASLQIVLLNESVSIRGPCILPNFIRYFQYLSRDNWFIPSVTFISWAMIIPFWITGSLYPTCVTDRSINLSVKHIWLLHFVGIILPLVSDQYKYTFEGLWYFFRGYRPSKTDHLKLSSTELVFHYNISRYFTDVYTPLYSTLYITNNNIRIQ